MRVIGLMSGTSLDGIDAALVEFNGDTVESLKWQMLQFHSRPYTSDEQNVLHNALVRGGPAELNDVHAQLGEWFAQAVIDVLTLARLAPDDIDLIGSHGQTIWHRARVNGTRGATLQLGCAATIAERTGIPVVSDFRSRDVAANGEGAPLVPWVDRALFSASHARVLQNIGGMANLTRLPPRGSSEPLIAFDTGPGNALIDAAMVRATNGRETFDNSGARAARGNVDNDLLRDLLSHPFYSQQPPRSTGREVFGSAYVDEIVKRRKPSSEQDWDDIVATLTALTAQSIAEACATFLKQHPFDELIVTGGGARNPTLVRMLQEALAPVRVRTGQEIGIDPDAKEAIAFAALAWAFANDIPGNVPEATGAKGERVIGSFTPGAAGRSRSTICKNSS